MLCFLMLCVCMPGTVHATEPAYTEFSDLNGKTVAMLTGAPFEELIRSKAPRVKAFRYFSQTADMILALKAGKIDAFLMNNAIASLLVNRDEALAVFPHNLGESTFGFAFAKESKERQKWQEAFQKISQQEIADAWEKWTGANETVKTLPKQDWPGSQGTVKVAACDTLEPMSYVGKDGQLVGFDIDLILKMAKQLDVHVEFTGMEFSALLSSVEAGKALFGAGSIIATDERKELVDFVEYYPAAFVLVVPAKQQASGKTGIFQKISDSFHRTFIKEGRYKMILSGLSLTVFMAIVAGLAGVVLGFLLVFLRHCNIGLCNRLIALYSSLVAGVPSVVILMVLYYVVFGFMNMSAILVAIIGFALIFGARAYGVIWNAVVSVDSGQREAALALGYDERQAFKEIILPQARQFYFPILQSQFVMLLKETSIAGYITVVDLTRAGDLIRSRTMAAFFPLISVAVIYFLLTWLLSKAIGLIDWRDQKKHDARKIKGVDA